MLSLFKPTAQRCEEQLKLAQHAQLSYSCRGCVETGDNPAGFSRDHGSCLLGSGEQVWRAAIESFEAWCFMPTSVVEVVAPDAIEVDRVVGVLFRGLGVWSFNPARIIEVHVGLENDRQVFGFTYGTVAGHMEKGEERFLLTWDNASDEVWYQLDAVSRPNHILAWLAYPYARAEQARFRKDSCASMLNSVKRKTANSLANDAPVVAV